MRDPSALLARGVVFPQRDDGMARTWFRVVHAVARREKGRVVGALSPPGVDRNFYAAVLQLSPRPLTLVLNTAAVLVAAIDGVKPFPPTAVYTSVPQPALFTAAGFAVADVEAMSAPLTEDDVEQLSTEEAGQVRYHRPDRVADVLFNWFD